MTYQWAKHMVDFLNIHFKFHSVQQLLSSNCELSLVNYSEVRLSSWVITGKFETLSIWKRCYIAAGTWWAKTLLTVHTRPMVKTSSARKVTAQPFNLPTEFISVKELLYMFIACCKPLNAWMNASMPVKKPEVFLHNINVKKLLVLKCGVRLTNQI